jgi:CO/xanthine dehydrogenase FAD-binding subunit
MAFEIARANSVRSAAALLADPGARLLGGGTLLVRDANSGDPSIRRLILADGLGLDAIRVADGRVELGAAVTMAAVARHPGLAFLHPVAGEIGSPAVRAMATIGGNLHARAPYGDFTVALVALAAEILAENAERSETIALEQFLASRDKGARMVTGVSFALPPANAFRFAKVMRRHPHGASVLSIAALLPIVDGRVKGARVAYGAMAPTAIRARAVEAALENQTLDAATIARAASVAAEGTLPMTDAFATDWYRRRVVPVHLTRLLSR